MEKVDYRIPKMSHGHIAAGIPALLGAALLFWNKLYVITEGYFSHGYEGIKEAAFLLGAALLLLFSLSLLIFGRRLPAVSGVLAVPCAVLCTVVATHTLEIGYGLATGYGSLDYGFLSSEWLVVLLLPLFIIGALTAYIVVCFKRAAGVTVPAVVIFVNTALWVFYSYLEARANYRISFGLSETLNVCVFPYLAVLLFFASMFIEVCSFRKKYEAYDRRIEQKQLQKAQIREQKAAAAAAAAAAYTDSLRSTEAEVDAAPQGVPMPEASNGISAAPAEAVYGNGAAENVAAGIPATVSENMSEPEPPTPVSGAVQQMTAAAVPPVSETTAEAAAPTDSDAAAETDAAAGEEAAEKAEAVPEGAVPDASETNPESGKGEGIDSAPEQTSEKPAATGKKSGTSRTSSRKRATAEGAGESAETPDAAAPKPRRASSRKTTAETEKTGASSKTAGTRKKKAEGEQSPQSDRPKTSRPRKKKSETAEAAPSPSQETAESAQTEQKEPIEV